MLGAVPGGTRVIPPTPPTPEPAPEPEPKSRKGLIWALVLIGIAALAGIVFLVTRGDSPIEPETVAVPSLEGMTEAQEADLGRQMLRDFPLDTVNEAQRLRGHPETLGQPGVRQPGRTAAARIDPTAIDSA